MRKIQLALLLLLACGTARAQVHPWFGTDPGPYRIEYAQTWEVPALLNRMACRCEFVIGVIPLETVSDETCVPVAPTPPPGGWGCHGSPPVCVDPPPPTQRCTQSQITSTVAVYTRLFSCSYVDPSCHADDPVTP